MPGSATSVFSDAEDFEAALRTEGCLGLLVPGRGQFRARLTQVSLHHWRLSATDEQLPRDTIVVSLPRDNGSAAICGGIRTGAGEIMTLGAGERLHVRTDGLSSSPIPMRSWAASARAGSTRRRASSASLFQPWAWN